MLLCARLKENQKLLEWIFMWHQVDSAWSGTWEKIWKLFLLLSKIIRAENISMHQSFLYWKLREIKYQKQFNLLSFLDLLLLWNCSRRIDKLKSLWKKASRLNKSAETKANFSLMTENKNFLCCCVGSNNVEVETAAQLFYFIGVTRQYRSSP